MDENGEQLVDENGELLYDTTWTRHGGFKLTSVPGDEDNLYLSTDDGTILVAGADGERIAIPRNHRINIDQNGTITAYNQNDEAVDVGQIRLAKVLNPQMLVGIGDHRFALPEGVQVEGVIEP